MSKIGAFSIVGEGEEQREEWEEELEEWEEKVEEREEEMEEWKEKGYFLNFPPQRLKFPT